MTSHWSAERCGEVVHGDVADGRVHWFISGGAGMRSDSGSNSAQQIASWVEQNFEATSVGDVTMYDLTAPLG